MMYFTSESMDILFFENAFSINICAPHNELFMIDRINNPPPFLISLGIQQEYCNNLNLSHEYCPNLLEFCSVVCDKRRINETVF